MRGKSHSPGFVGRALAISVALLFACGKANLANTALTPATHKYFPIVTGPHAVDCNSCHGNFGSFAQFSCLGCHTHDQTPTDQVHQGVAGYTYDSKACYSCHPDGSKLPFPHAGISGGCASCHDVGAPFAALPVAGLTHPPMLGNDCGVCHGFAAWTPANGPAVLSSDPTRSVTANALIPSYSGTSIVSLSAQVETLVMPMNHQSTAVVSTVFSNCANCHINAAANSFYPGDLHSSLANLKLAEPTVCSDCHATSAPKGFVGPLATSPARTPASGEMKHDAVLWSNGQPTSTSAVPYDCGICHQSPAQAFAATWSQSSTGTPLFHSSIAAAALAQPGSCVDCHASSRPNAVLSWANASLPANLQFDHTTSAALADCSGCHLSGSATQWTAWSGGRFHVANSATPSTCLPCHAGERPTTSAGWTSTSYAASPFDYGTNATGVTHGGGQDCVVCHQGPGTGAWGGAQNWVGGHFTHDAQTSLSATTCFACHMSQRPDLQPGTTAAAMAALLGFDHSVNGTGDCFGCHQSTVAAGSYVSYLNPTTQALPGGDWRGAIGYPGSTLVGTAGQNWKVAELTLNRSGPNGLVTSATSTQATLYNQMLHVSTAIPSEIAPGPTAAPSYGQCWHCHQNDGGTVSAYANGQFHPSLNSYTADAGGGPITPLPQPTRQCSDCHAQMRPVGVVEKSGSDLIAMDHNAVFAAPATIAGVSVTGVAGLDCSVCHQSQAGTTWADGVFHANIAPAVPADCTVCHYPAMADMTIADLVSSPSYGMKHGSSQLTFQNCQRCHTGALANGVATPLSSTLWSGGAFHANIGAQPTACVDCHAISEPTALTTSSVAYSLWGGSATNVPQWMSHGSTQVAGKDCVSCHATDATSSGSAWSKSDSFHASVPGASGCQDCHGLTNGGGSTPGTNNDLPAGLVNSTTVSTASSDSTTGVPAGTYDQISHTDVNVSSHDCNFCHTQAGPSTVAGIQGREWAQARFHTSFSTAYPLILNGTTGRCSNCHTNVEPTSAFPIFDHTTIGTKDCSSCHSWPGTGTASSPNWLGAGAAPQYITVGGFSIPQPPASTATTQTGIANLPHPSVTGIACTTCHTNAAGGKPAIGYDHASPLINTNCGSCHEGGSNLVGASWNGATAQSSGAGDTRPYTLTSVTATYSGNSLNVTYRYHFYPVDCYQCHVKPSGNGLTTTGSAYTTAWHFPHNQSTMTNPTTCVMCHTQGIPN